MTTYCRPSLREPLDVTTLLRLALSAPEPARPPDDAVPLRAAHYPQWSRGAPLTATWCDDSGLDVTTAASLRPAVCTPPTQIDWSDEAIEEFELRMAQVERTRRKRA